MIAVRTLAACFLLLLAASQPASARQPGLNEWFDRKLTPYVAEQLTSHPRFKGETVRFVVMSEGNPEALSNALGLELRDRLRNAVSELPGVTVAWKGTPQAVTRNNRSTGIDCAASQVDYYVGIELTDGGQGNLNIRLRALDVAERSWVSGFGKDWYGPLSHTQRRALRQVRRDPGFLGERDVPYSIDQTDLLATHLAHDLGCLLLSEMSSEYSISPARADDVDMPLDDVVQLVSNNLSSYRALQMTPDDLRANASIEGRAHQIDAGLFQYWVTVKPKGADADIPSLSTSAYIYLPQQYIAALVEPEVQEAIWRSGVDLLQSTRVVGIDSHAQCSNNGDTNRDRRVYAAGSGSDAALCYALQVEVREDAVLFFVNHQPNHGLVRMADSDCDLRTHARIAKTDQRIRLHLPMDTHANVSWRPADGWDLSPDADTYVAIAVNDTIAARAIASHLQRLPARCSSSVRVGLDGDALRLWTRDLVAIIENWQAHIDWESVRVKNVY